MSNRKTISQQVQVISPYDWDTSLKRVREQIDELIAQYGEDARLDWDPNFYHSYDDTPSPRYSVVVNRQETDEEMVKREAGEENMRKLREAAERKEYERLQKKFKNG